MRTLLSPLLLHVASVLLAGCSGSQPDGTKFQHDEAAKLFLEAMQVRDTDLARAVVLLSQSLEARPSYNAYYHRAWIHALQGRDEQAMADVASGLKLEPDAKDLTWLDGELRKPVEQRKLNKPLAPVK